MNICPGCLKSDKTAVSVRVITYWNNRRMFRVVCMRCNWQGPEKDTEERAIDAWNKRYEEK
jgi:C4-type Zn-finger protein